MTSTRLWVALLAGVAGTFAAAALGNWQTHRAEYKQGLQAQWDAAERAAPVPIGSAADLRALAAPDARLPLRVRLTGQWQHERSVWLDNRPLEGRVGFLVITPLRLTDGAVVLVNRGWAPRQMQDRTQLPAIGEPRGPVVVEGLALAHPPRVMELAKVTPEKPPAIWQNLDFETYRRLTGLDVPALLVQQTDADGNADVGLTRRWPRPDTGVDRHRGYAFQWYSLAALIAGLTVFFGVRAWRRRAAPATTH